VKLLCDSIINGEGSLERVAEKDVVLIVGKTGTGKSTLIQGIAGRELRAVVHQTKQWSGTAQKEVFEATAPLPEFEIGHVKTSMTKQINCYVREASEEVVYLDTPGFEDTDGHEIDIATSVMLSKVAERCRSLRFVILINCASLLEDRGGAIRAVLKQIRNFVPVFTDARQSFMFLFTHMDEIRAADAQKDFLKGEITRTAEGTTDEGVLSVLKFMQKSLKKGFPFVDILHPLKSDFPKLVQTIENPEVLVPFSKDHLSRNCGLTSASRLTLSSELQSLVQRVRQVLASQGSLQGGPPEA
jgi:GTP-binding protein EngB required for normal cell division